MRSVGMPTLFLLYGNISSAESDGGLAHKALKNCRGGIIKVGKHKFFCYDPLIMGVFCKFTVEARDDVKCKIKCNHLRMIEGGFL